LKTAEFPRGEVVLDMSHIPAMARRRLGYLAKMAVTVADDVLQHASHKDLPVVWASRYGDADKSLALLQSKVAGGEVLSPTAFGLSVHNGVGAQHSILRGMTANAVCIASSHCAPEAGIVEAIGLLHEGAQEVLCVVYDIPLPESYQQFHDEPVADIAWAALLGLPQPSQAHFELLAEQAAAVQDVHREKPAKHLPHMLEVHRFLMDSQMETLSHPHPGGVWMWRRVHA